MNLWLIRKFIFQKSTFREPTFLFAVGGIAIGVAFLVAVMAGFSGFAETLKRSIVDISGDITVYKRGGGRIADKIEFESRLRTLVPEIQAVVPFARVEAMVAKNGKLSTVHLTGIDWKQAGKVLNFENRVIEMYQGDVQEAMGTGAYLGKEIAMKLRLKVGDSFRAIVVNSSKTSSVGMSSQSTKLYVQSIVDFGKHDFNERFVLTDLAKVQSLAKLGERISGFNIRLKNSLLTVEKTDLLQNELGWSFSAVNWTQIHRSLFAAIEYEKKVLFFVMLIMVIAAFFNVSTTLYLNVLKRYAQVSVLKTLGVRGWEIIVYFCLNGLVLGAMGLSLGLGLGFLFCWMFEFVQRIYPVMPSDVYKVTFVSTTMEMKDLGMIAGATLLICFLSTLAPAFRGARLSPVEGLKYE